MFGDWKLNEFQQWQEMWRPEPSILGVDLISSLEAINHSFTQQLFSAMRPRSRGNKRATNKSKSAEKRATEANSISTVPVVVDFKGKSTTCSATWTRMSASCGEKCGPKRGPF